MSLPNKITTSVAKVLSLLVVLFMLSCSANPYSAAVDMITGGSDGPSLDVEVETDVVDGNKEEAVIVDVGSSDTQVEQHATNITNNQEIPVEFLLICVIGWLLPSPNEMWRGLCNTVKGIATFRRK